MNPPRRSALTERGRGTEKIIVDLTNVGVKMKPRLKSDSNKE